MPARTRAPRWSAVVISLSVAILTLGFAPSARADATYDELWVANSASGAVTVPGTSCANPGFTTAEYANAAISAAVDVANNNATIHLCAGIYTFGTSVLSELANVTFAGAGTASTFIVGNRTTPFFLSTGNVTVSGMNVSGGYSGDQEGGAISVFGNLTVLNSYFRSNYSEKGGGAIAAGGPITINNSIFYNNSTSDQGGAVASYSTVTVTGSAFTANESIADEECVGGGGAIAAGDDVYVTGSRFTNNAALLTVKGFCVDTDPYAGPVYGGKGGAIATLGYAFVTDSTFTSNRAAISGGAIAELTPAAPTGGGHIGGIYTRSTFIDNDATVAAGAVLVHGITKVTASAFKSNRSGLAGGSAIFSNGTLNVSRSTFAKNALVFATASLDFDGGGAGAISGITVNVTTSNFDRNTGAIYGGAIGAETLRVTFSVFTNNTAWITGGAITAYDLVVKNSRFTKNATKVLVDLAGATSHGGGAIFVCHTLNVDYSTFTGNSTKGLASTADFVTVGGAIAGYGTSATISHSWFVSNTASGRGGAINLGNNLNGQGDPMTVTLTRNRFNYNVAGSYGGAVELGTNTAASLLASKYNSFVGNRASTGGAAMSVFVAGGISQANLNKFGTSNTFSGNRGPGARLLLIPSPI